MSTATATQAPDHAALFDAEPWLFDPLSGKGFYRDDLRKPCPCGGRIFLLIERAGGPGSSHTNACKACYRNPAYRTLRRAGDRIYARIEPSGGEYRIVAMDPRSRT